MRARRGARPGSRPLAATLALCAATGLLLGAPPAARAEFSVAPTVIDVRRSPGGVAAGTFGVRLQGERGRRFAIAVQDVAQDAQGAFTFRAPRRSRFSASRWLAVSPRAFAGGPDREQPVDFRVRVPRDAEPGDHVTSLTVKRLARARPGGAGLVQAVAVRLTVRVSGTARAAVEVGKPSAPALVGGGPIAAAVLVRNTGNVRLDFGHHDRGELVARPGERDAARAPFRGLLYPGEAREFRLTWPNPPAFGHFRIEADARTSGGRASAHTTVWVLPWRQAGALLLAIAAALVLAGGRRRRHAAS